MKYISFDKSSLINLKYSLNKEVLRANNLGAFWSSTLLGCNTRKYHGLLISPVESKNNENYVFLSTINETVIQHEAEFNLGINKFPNIYLPKGHKYVRNFEFDPVSKITYRVGGVVLDKEILLVEDKRQILIKYTLIDAHSPTTLRLKPFLSFRNIHALSKANLYANTKYDIIQNGIEIKLYEELPALMMQLSKKNDFITAPDWYYNFEYPEEQKRGYDYQEDLFTPGYFEFSIKKNESIIFSASIDETSTRSFKQKFQNQINKIEVRNNFNACLKSAAKQFIVKRGNKTEIIAGYPWFGRWGRDSFISLPGLTLSTGNADQCEEVLLTLSAEMKNGLFPNIGSNEDVALNSVDAPLWFFWAVKKYADHIGDPKKIWKLFAEKMKEVISAFVKGTVFNIKMHDNGLIYAGEQGFALTWMDAMVGNNAVTPRIGYAVEINALWYFALSFMTDLAKENGDKGFVDQWQDMLVIIKQSFNDTFWDDRREYLADVVNNDVVDWSVRPNQIFATSMEYSPLNNEQKNAIIELVKKELLTTKGLRTLSPKNHLYKGKYKGDQTKRDNAYHQGTAWPWLLGHFAEANLRLHGKTAIPFVKSIIKAFEEDMFVHGIASISEIYDGDPPHKPRGAISQAWSVAEILRIKTLVQEYK